jgi:predicted transcriptional regulator
MNDNKTVTKTSRLVEALRSGEELTTAQIRARFGLANPTATLSDLRDYGYTVFRARRTDTKGRVKTKYMLGTPVSRLFY